MNVRYHALIHASALELMQVIAHKKNHRSQRINGKVQRSEGLTAVAAPLWLLFGQSLHHVLDPPQLLLDLDVPLARGFRLRSQHRCIVGTDMSVFVIYAVELRLSLNQL